jgi:hypothetical protein
MLSSERADVVYIDKVKNAIDCLLLSGTRMTITTQEEVQIVKGQPWDTEPKHGIPPK